LAGYIHKNGSSHPNFRGGYRVGLTGLAAVVVVEGVELEELEVGAFAVI
jgi:hypothetical protein